MLVSVYFCSDVYKRQAMFKINSDLERLGDFAEGIARFVVRSEETVLDSELLHFGRTEILRIDGNQFLSLIHI